MNRRGFLAAGLAAGTGALISTVTAQAQTQDDKTGSSKPSGGNQPFKLKYAPHFGMFEKSAGKDPIDQLKFMADNGFTALEDNGMMKRPVDLQEKIGAELQRLKMEMGVFVTNAEFGRKSFVLNDPEMRKELVGKCREAIQVAKRVNAKYTTVVLDQYDPAQDWGVQTANAIDNLRACAEVFEPEGIIMVLEPLNKNDHPGLFLTGSAQCYAICRAVNSPSCKILFDIYHQQKTEGNLIPNIDACWSEIAYIQIGDNPGRKEPTTGEINYKNIFRHLHVNKKFTGILGMEHGKANNSVEGEQALIAAYRSCDNFEV